MSIERVFDDANELNDDIDVPLGMKDVVKGVVAAGPAIEPIKRHNKLVIDIAGRYLLVETLANQALHLTEQSPLNFGDDPVVVTADAFAKIRRSWFDTISNYEVYRVIYLSDVGLSWRIDDIITVDTFAAYWNGQESNWIEFAQRLLTLYAKRFRFMHEILTDMRFCALNLIRAHHHRCSNDGSNGNPALTQKSGTNSHGLCALAGDDREAFQRWLSVGERCHDDFHVLLDVSIELAADALTGYVKYSVPAGYAIVKSYHPERHPLVLDSPFEVDYIFYVGSAAESRHPALLLGFHGIVAMTEALGKMVSFIRMKLGGGPRASKTILEIQHALKCPMLKAVLKAQTIREIATAYLPIGVFALGVLKAKKCESELIRNTRVLRELIANEGSSYIAGVEVGRSLESPLAVSTTTVDALNYHMARFDHALIVAADEINLTVASARDTFAHMGDVRGLPSVSRHTMGSWI